MPISISSFGVPFARPPSVSVVVTCFNQAGFVDAAIRSVAAQTYTSFDCVVVDDLSTDTSPKAIGDSIAALDDERFRFLQRDNNGGQMAAMLTGFDATGDPLVTFLDGDDAWSPDFLERHVSAHLSRVGVAALSTSDAVLVDETGAIVAGHHPSFRKGDPRRGGTKSKVVAVDGKGDDALVFVGRGVTSWLWSMTSGMMFRRDAIDVMRPNDPNGIPICADSYLAPAAHMLGGTVRVERVLGSYRLHAANAWARRQFVGQGSELGKAAPEWIAAIRAALAERWCIVAPELEQVLSRSAIRRTLIDLVGWSSAFDLAETDPHARSLLEGWTTVGRKRLLKLAQILPEALRPRRFR